MPLSREPQLDPSDIRLLRVFRKVVECGGFSNAQAELNVSASTISTQMTTLESRLGMRLCDRGRVGFRLTDKGRRVYAASLRLEEAVDAFRTDVGELRGKLVGELHVGIVDSTATHADARLHDALARFTRRDHAVHVTLHVAEPAVLEKRLLGGELHVGIAAYYHHVPGLAYETLFYEDHALYCGRHHPLFDRPEPGAADVSRAAYVMRGYMAHRHAAPFAGLNAAATAYDMEAILTLVRAGGYIGHLPTHYAQWWVDRGELRRLLPGRFDFRSHFEFAIRKGASRPRVVTAFLEDLAAAHAGVNAADTALTRA